MRKKAELPNWLRICGRRVEVREECPDLNISLMGLHQSFPPRITIHGGLGEDQKRVIMLHELIHDMELVLGIDLGEQTVMSMANVMFGIFRDNPDFVRWVMEW